MASIHHTSSRPMVALIAALSLISSVHCGPTGDDDDTASDDDDTGGDDDDTGDDDSSGGDDDDSAGLSSCPSNLSEFTEEEDNGTPETAMDLGTSSGFCIQGNANCGDGLGAYDDLDLFRFQLPEQALAIVILEWSTEADFDRYVWRAEDYAPDAGNPLLSYEDGFAQSEEGVVLLDADEDYILEIGCWAGDDGPYRVTMTTESEGDDDDSTGGDDDDSTVDYGSDWESLYEVVIEPSCSCHVGGSSGGLEMPDANTSYNNLVGIAASNASMYRVAPGDATQSYIMHKLDGTQSTVTDGGGLQMPRNLPPLAEAARDALRAWINAGAALTAGDDDDSTGDDDDSSTGDDYDSSTGDDDDSSTGDDDDSSTGDDDDSGS